MAAMLMKPSSQRDAMVLYLRALMLWMVGSQRALLEPGEDPKLVNVGVALELRADLERLPLK